jgi:hypothetical protein
MHRLIALLVGFVLLGGASASGLVIYNAGSSELIEDTVAAFNRAHPEINVTVVSAGVGQHTTRIEAEAGNPRGDIFFGASVESFEAIIDLFEPYQALRHDEYDPVFVHPSSATTATPSRCRRSWSTRTCSPRTSGPQSWADLADPRFAGKIIMANPSLSGLCLRAARADAAALRLGPHRGRRRQHHLRELVAAGVPERRARRDRDRHHGRGEHRHADRGGLAGDGDLPERGHRAALRLRWASSPAARTPRRAHLHGLGDLAGEPRDRRPALPPLRAGGRAARRSGWRPPTEVPTFPYDPDLAAATRDENLRRFDEIFSAR